MRNFPRRVAPEGPSGDRDPTVIPAWVPSPLGTQAVNWARWALDRKQMALPRNAQSTENELFSSPSCEKSYVLYDMTLPCNELKMYSTGTETFPAFFEWWKIIELLNDTPSFERCRYWAILDPIRSTSNMWTVRMRADSIFKHAYTLTLYFILYTSSFERCRYYWHPNSEF